MGKTSGPWDSRCVPAQPTQQLYGVQELEGAGHTASTVKEQSVTHTRFLHGFLCRIPAQGIVLPTVRMGLLTSINAIKTQAQRPVSWVTLDSVRSTVNTSHHTVATL